MPAELAWQWEEGAGGVGKPRRDVATDAELEADDVMLSFALAEVGGGRDRGRTEAEREREPATADLVGQRALLLSGDRDPFQAVTDRVSVVIPGKGGEDPKEIGPAQVRERYGIDPPLVTDFIALRGDPSDGLPGAPGIGAKTAAELLNHMARWRRC